MKYVNEPNLHTGSNVDLATVVERVFLFHQVQKFYNLQKTFFYTDPK